MDIAGRKADKQWLENVIQMVGLADPASATALAALRRPAAARRGRPRPGLQARHHLRRRAHRKPGLALRRRGPRLPAQLRARAGPDRGDGHPRPGRGGLRGPRGLPGGRPDRRRDARPDGGHGPGPHEALRREGPHQLTQVRPGRARGTARATTTAQHPRTNHRPPRRVGHGAPPGPRSSIAGGSDPHPQPNGRRADLPGPDLEETPHVPNSPAQCLRAQGPP